MAGKDHREGTGSDAVRAPDPTEGSVAGDVSAEDELRAAHQRTVEILESITDAFYAVDYDWRLTYVNRRTEELWGQKREDLLGRSLWELFPQPDEAEGFQMHQRAADQREPVSFETFSPTLQMWMDVRIYPGESGLSVYFQDTTARRAAHEAGRRSQERLQAFLDQLPVGAGMVDANGNWIFKNPVLDRLAPGKLAATDPEAGPRWRGWSEDGRPLDASEWPGARALRGEAVRPGVELLRTLGDGGERWVRVTATPYLGADGAVLGAIIVAEDVTARKKSEAALRDTVEALEQERTMLDVILEALPVGVVIADSEGRIVRDNAATRELWGVPPETGSWESYAEWVGWWPETGERITAEEWAMARALHHGEHTRNELVRNQKFDTDERRYYLNNVSPIYGDSGAIVGAVGALLDVTERLAAEQALRRSEERFRALVTASSEVVFRINHDWTEVRTLGGPASLANPGERGELWISEFVHPEDRAAVAAAVLVAMEAKSVFEQEHRVRRADGSTAWLLSRAVPLLDELGEVVEWVGAATDVTERKEAEEGLRAAKDAAEEASRVKSQFLSTMSHELRTPLTAVIGMSDLLETEVLGEMSVKQKVALDRIRRSAWHLVHIIDEILTFSRSEAGKEQMRLADVDFAAVVRDAFGMFAPASGEPAGIHLHGAKEPIPAFTDEGKVRQILVNLIGNAEKHSRGDVDVQVGGDEAWVEVRVRDAGPGIPPDRLEEIFEPFVQLDSSSTREKGGTGLGLTIARRQARLLGGDVTAGSTPGEGSTFTLRLPRRTARTL